MTLLLAALLPMETQGAQATEAPQHLADESGCEAKPDPAHLRQDTPEPRPDTLVALAARHVQEGRLGEAEVLAAHLVRVDPGSTLGWELLAVSRYLQDDSRGALQAWGRSRTLVVRYLEVRIVGPRGPRTTGAPFDPARISGITPGCPLTPEALMRGERRLRALPAASRARLGYRALSGSEAEVDGALVLNGRNPFATPELVALGLRLLGRRVHLVSADPLGHMEQWELDGSVEGSLMGGSAALAHLAPGDLGVWRWELEHRVGRYGAPNDTAAIRIDRTGLGLTHAHWITASVQGRAHGRIDHRPDQGTHVGAGMGWTLLPLAEWGSLRADGTGWMRLGGAAPPDGGPGSPTRFGRLSLRADLHPPARSGPGAPLGVAARAGLVAVSSETPHDLAPRAGAGGGSELLMRAGSDLDREGVVRHLFPGSAWIHGGIEYVHPVASVGPAGIGVAAFADGLRVLSSSRSGDDQASMKGAVHLGTGLRARVPGVDGWLRVDWGIDPARGASRLSAAWVTGRPQ